MMIPQLALTAILLCSLLSGTTAGRIPTARHVARDTAHVRGSSINTLSLRHTSRHLLHPMHHGHGGTSYLGCLNYTDAELEEEWIFQGDAPNCSYVSYGSGDDDDDHDENDASNGGDDDSYGGGGGDGGDGGDGNGNGEGEGGDENGENKNGDDYYGGGGNDDGAGDEENAGNGYDGKNGDGNGNYYDKNDGDGYVVDNGDVSDEDYDGSENPMEAFNINDCSTYANLWVWDLAFSCDSDTSLANCECTFTEQLFDQEMLTCDEIESCPSECPVCATCMQLVGCTPVPDVFERNGVSSSTIFAIAAAAALLLFAAVYYYARRHKQNEEYSLEDHLLEKDLKSSPPQIGQTPDTAPAIIGAGTYDPESTLGAYPDIPDFRSDLSSLGSHTLESEQTPTSYEAPVKEIELSTTPPQSVAGDVPASTDTDDMPTSTEAPSSDILASTEAPSSDEEKPSMVMAAAVAAVIAATTDTPPSDEEKSSASTDISFISETPPSDEEKPSASASFPATTEAPPSDEAKPSLVKADTTTSVPTAAHTSSSVPVVPLTTTYGNSVRHAKIARNENEPTESSNSLAAASGPSAAGVGKTPLSLTMKEKFDKFALRLKKEGIATEGGGPDSTPATSVKPSEDVEAQVPAVTPNGSPAMEHSDSDGSDSESPWIGDVDLSFEAYDDASEAGQTEVTENKASEAGGNDPQPYDEADASPTEPSSVWLVPLDDLEDEPTDQEPGNDVFVDAAESEATEEPSTVWLAPSSSPAELAPEKKEDDSSSESSWSPDGENDGPWLAPI